MHAKKIDRDYDKQSCCERLSMKPKYGRGDLQIRPEQDG